MIDIEREICKQAPADDDDAPAIRCARRGGGPPEYMIGVEARPS